MKQAKQQVALRHLHVQAFKAFAADDLHEYEKEQFVWRD